MPPDPIPDPWLLQEDGEALLCAPRMLLKAALEQGVSVVAVARLGSPDAAVELVETHRGWLADRGVEALVMPDAAQAVAAARGAVEAGRPGLVMLSAAAVESVASDLLQPVGGSVSGLGQGTETGVVLAVGPVDSRPGRDGVARCIELGLAVFEPALHAEVGAWFATAARAGSVLGGVAVLGLAGELWDGFASVPCGPNAGSERTPSGVSGGRPVGRGPVDAVVGLAREAAANRIINPPGRDEALPLGLVAGGVGYARLRQVVSELGLVGRLPILRLGLTGPIDAELVARHARDCRRLLVVDHESGVFFRGVSQALQGSDDSEAATVEALLDSPGATPAAVLAGLAPYLRDHPGVPREVLGGALSGLEAQVASALAVRVDAPARDVLPPPGSALVDVAAVLGRLRRDLTDAQYMSEHHGQGPMDVVVFGELDDQSRLLLEQEQPLTGVVRVDGGVAGGAAQGAGAGGGARPVVLMNGRELFASGYSAIASAARHGRDVTFVIHTEEPVALKPRRRRGLRRRPTPGVLDLPAMLAALGSAGEGESGKGVTVGVLDPTDRPRLRQLLERSLVGSGVQVVLARRREGPRAVRALMAQWQEEAVTRGYVPTQQRLVLCPEVWPLNRAQRLQLGPLGLEPAAGESGGWMTASSWAWGGKAMLKALTNPALGLALVQRGGPERIRLDSGALKGLPALPHPMHAEQEVWRSRLAGVAGAGLELLVGLVSEAGASLGYSVRGTRTPWALEAGTGAWVEVMFTSRPREQALSVVGSPGRSTRPLFSTTATPGSVDLLLGLDAAEAVRAVVGTGHADRTGVVVDSAGLPTLAALSSAKPTAGASASTLARLLSDRKDTDRRQLLPAGELCEYLFGHRRYAAWLVLGAAMQRGLVPLTRASVESATRRVLGVRDARCMQAFDVGRKAALDPGFAASLVDPEPADPAALLATATEDLAQQYGGRSGPGLSREFHGLVAPLLERCADLDDAVCARLVQVGYRCVVWGGRRGGVAYARRFCETVALLLDHDHADRGYDLTRRGIEGAARAMLVPDEVYLAALLTSPARYRRDRRRLNIALEQGDKVTYRHVVRPEFDIFKRHIAFNLTLGERALRLLSRLHVVRRVRTGWYREQRDFRDLYLRTLGEMADTASRSGYRKWCEIASSAATIAGRGEARRAAVADARTRLDRLAAVDAKQLGGE